MALCGLNLDERLPGTRHIVEWLGSSPPASKFNYEIPAVIILNGTVARHLCLRAEQFEFVLRRSSRTMTHVEISSFPPRLTNVEVLHNLAGSVHVGRS